MTSNLTSPKHHLVKPFYASFDGLRACAFLGVFSWHMSLSIPVVRSWLHWGWAGVDLFFVLSGFLISGILLDTVGQPGFFRNFYFRRTLRIFPVYYAFWLAMLLLTPVFHFEWNRYVVSTVFYLGNFFTPGYYLHLHANPCILNYTAFGERGQLLFEHFWSLCVEEQFYLIWPAIIWLVRSRRSLLMICLAGIAATPCLRIAILHFHHEQLVAEGLYFPTYVRCDSLLTGAALAIWSRTSGNISLVSIRRSALIVLAVSLAILATIVKLDSHHSDYPIIGRDVCSVGFTLIAFAAGALLIYCLFEDTLLSRLLQWKPLRAIGRLSYGMYIFHELLLTPLKPVLVLLKKHHLVLLFPVLVFALTLAIAYLSFRFLESPFLRLKNAFAPRPGAVSDPPPVSQPLNSPEQAATAHLQPIPVDVRS